MAANPFLGVVYHWTGGLAAGSFYIPYRAVKRWSWETYWLVGGIFSWIIAPWVFAVLLVPDTWGAIVATAPRTLLWSYVFGALWGFGGLTFGLTMRYLGIALGVAVALGLCNAFGTLMPPIVSGEISEITRAASGQMILLGVLVCMAGIAVSGAAGISKERELSSEEKTSAIPEFNLTKGLLVAIFSGVMSSCFAYGLAAGKPLAIIAQRQLLAAGSSDLWRNLPVLIVVLAGGFTTNFVWCVILNVRNRSGHQYLNLRRSAVAEVSASEGVIGWNAEELTNRQTVASNVARGAAETRPAHGPDPSAASDRATEHVVVNEPAPLLTNYALSALAGVTWYLQFFFYGMGETQMGKYGFSSWTLHMASIIIFSTLWGIALKEWRGTSTRTHVLIAVGLALLILSTLTVGYGNFLKTGPVS
jgi:L-rhamnose-H+ transport protein